jgi:hypothetical protein
MGRWVLAGTSKSYGKEETDMDTGRERQKKNMTERGLPNKNQNPNRDRNWMKKNCDRNFVSLLL